MIDLGKLQPIVWKLMQKNLIEGNENDESISFLLRELTIKNMNNHLKENSYVKNNYQKMARD